MIFYFLFALSLSTESPIQLEVGKNIASLSVNEQITIKNINPQTFFLFLQPIPKEVEISVESNEGIIGKINNENIGAYFGGNSGSISIRNSGDKLRSTSLTFYFLSSTHNASRHFISTYQEDAFVISYSASFSTCRSYRENNPIIYWHVTGRPQKLVSSFANEDPENTVLYAYDKILENQIKAKSTDPVTISAKEFIYFLWNSEVNDKKGSYKITIQQEKSDIEYEKFSLPELRYEFSTKSKTSLLSANHNYGDYDKLEKLGQPIPLNQISDEDDKFNKNKNNVIRLSFDHSALTILISLIAIIVILLFILIYVGLMPVPSSSSILNPKHHNDEESLLKDNEKSPELAAFLKSNR